MRNLFIITIALLLGGCSASKAPATLIAMAGSGSDTVLVIDKASKESVMKIPLPERDAECNSVEVNEDGSVLFSYRRGVRMVSRDGIIVWDLVREKDDEEYQSATFADGEVVVGVCGHPSKIIEVRGFGDKVKIINFDSGIEHIHSQFRQIKKSRNGNYLVPFMGRNETWEIDSLGKTVKSYPVGGFSVVELEGGDLMVSTGDDVVVVGRESGEIVKEYDLPKGSFITEANVLDNGNLLVSNWQGHNAPDAELEWMVIEVNGAGEVVWEYKDKRDINFVSALHQYKEFVEE